MASRAMQPEWKKKLTQKKLVRTEVPAQYSRQFNYLLFDS